MECRLFHASLSHFGQMCKVRKWELTRPTCMCPCCLFVCLVLFTCMRPCCFLFVLFCLLVCVLVVCLFVLFCLLVCVLVVCLFVLFCLLDYLGGYACKSFQAIRCFIALFATPFHLGHSTEKSCRCSGNFLLSPQGHGASTRGPNEPHQPPLLPTLSCRLYSCFFHSSRFCHRQVQPRLPSSDITRAG